MFVMRKVSYSAVRYSEMCLYKCTLCISIFAIVPNNDGYNVSCVYTRLGKQEKPLSTRTNACIGMYLFVQVSACANPYQ